MIIAFTYFYTAVTVNPNQMAEDMKKKWRICSRC